MIGFLAVCFAKALRTGIVLLLIFGVLGAGHLYGFDGQQAQGGKLCWTVNNAPAFCALPPK